jgi:hypothetical protein
MENIDYKHLYLKYKKKYLNLKNQIGGSAQKATKKRRTLQELAANVPHTPKKSRIKIRRIPRTAQTQREYYNFFNDVSRVLYCIILKLQERGLNISVNFKNSGIYFNIAPNIYLSIHSTTFTSNGENYIPNRFHINQGGRQFSLAIQNRDNQLIIIKKIDNYSWDNVDRRMNQLLDEIQDCINENNEERRLLEQENIRLRREIKRLKNDLLDCDTD